MDYVSHLEHELSLSRMRTDIKREIRQLDETVNKKIVIVDDKIDSLRDIVLPMAESSKQTASNTLKTADLMERFTDEQRRTNGKFHDKFHSSDLKFAGIDSKFADVGVRLDARAESKKMNATLMVSVIGLVGIVVSGIFAIAPDIFN